MDAMRMEARRVAQQLREAGYLAYFAGGCVRDQLLGKEPKDYDIATNATPTEVHAIFPRAHTVGAHFGVMLVHVGDFDFEIATFRTDGSYKDGRRPESVTFSTPEEDARRRDFTINGLFYDPVEDRVIDFVEGQKDLASGILRAIGKPNERFQEDYLRLMRAARFASMLGYEIAPETWAAMKACAGGLARISIERIREEFSRMMLHPSRVRGFDLLAESGLMAQFLPEILALKGCEQPPEYHPEGDVFVHTRLMLSLLPEEVSLPLVLSILFHDIGKPATFMVDETGRIRFNGHDKLGAEMTELILRRMRYSNEVTEATVAGVANHMKFMHVQDMRVAKLKQFMARPTFSDELELHRVDCTSSHGMLDNYEFLLAKRGEFASEPLIPPPLINGRDLMDLGFRPGPKMGEVLVAVQTLQLEKKLSTREEAVQWVRENFEPV